MSGLTNIEQYFLRLLFLRLLQKYMCEMYLAGIQGT